jgi:hypothetical protein
MYSVLLSIHLRSKLRRVRSPEYWWSGTRVGSASCTSPISGTALTVPEPGSMSTRRLRGSELSLSPSLPPVMGGRMPRRSWFSSASREGVFQAGGRVSAGGGGGRLSFRPFSQLSPGTPVRPPARTRTGRLREISIQVPKRDAPPGGEAQEATVTGPRSAVKTVAGKILGSRSDPWGRLHDRAYPS